MIIAEPNYKEHFMLYHVSQHRGLTTLRPQISTHGNAYVYAVDNIVTGLLFGAKKDDFDFFIYTNENEEDINELIDWLNKNKWKICCADIIVMCK